MDFQVGKIDARYLILFAVLGYLTVSIVRALLLHFRRQRRARLHGCEQPPSASQIDPIFGLDIVFQALSSFRKNKRNASLAQQFSDYGNTFQSQVYNRTKICTIAPKNLQSVFGTDFESWGIAPLRLFFFGPFIGKGIMTTDGSFWSHSRALLKPTFSRGQISDLSAYRVHVNNLIAALPDNGSDVDLKPYFENLALDSSTEFLFGNCTHALTPSPTLDAQAFLQAYNYGQAGIGKRMQLPQWDFLTRDSRFWRSCALARAFVEKCVNQALSSHQAQPKKSPSNSRLVLAHELASQTTDRTDIVNQLLNVFLPAHDATAVALTNTFFHLSRHPLVYANLRKEILAMGPHANWTFERLKGCKYLQAVMNETFRLNPSIGQMNRVALRDTMLPTGGGADRRSPIFVKNGTVLTTSFYALHRLPEIWGADAELWKPDRWLQPNPGLQGGEEGLIKVGHWTFLPFGGGPRICVGMQLALTEVGYAIGRVVEKYREVVCKDEVWDFVEEWKITTVSRNGAKVRLVPA